MPIRLYRVRRKQKESHRAEHPGIWRERENLAESRVYDEEITRRIENNATERTDVGKRRRNVANDRQRRAMKIHLPDRARSGARATKIQIVLIVAR